MNVWLMKMKERLRLHLPFLSQPEMCALWPKSYRLILYSVPIVGEKWIKDLSAWIIIETDF